MSEDGGHKKVTDEGGLRRSILVKERTGAEEVGGMVKETVATESMVYFEVG